MWNPVKIFDANERGRDFAVGDIHGCFERLQYELDAIGFDASMDRLFSVGDLVDRGPSSEDAVDWIAKPWFHAVRGNHEEMAIGVAAGKHDKENYAVNGGGWFLSLPHERQRLVANVFASLPYAMQVTVEGRLIGIVHAEVAGDSWPKFLADLESAESNNKRRNLREIALWARTRIQDAQAGREVAPIAGADLVLVGHTPLVSLSAVANIRYLDTGCVFGGKLTVVEIAELLRHA